jgi:hypothetical protein
LTREVTGLLDPSQHFYQIQVSEDGQRKQENIVLLEGKMLLAGLAGARIESEIDEATATLEHLRATARITWRAPDGELHLFARDREYDVHLEYHKSVLKKARGALYGLKKERPEVYREIARAFAQDDEPEQALMNVVNKLLPPEDLMQLRIAQMEIRTHLRALCRSKAISQALTEFLRYVGARLRYKSMPTGAITVTLLNTIEIPEQGPQEATRMLYGGGEDVEDRETEEILRSAEEAEEAVPGDGEEAEAVPQSVDPETGEILPTPEPTDAEKSEDGPTREDLAADINLAAVQLGLNKAGLLLFAAEKCKFTGLKDLTIEQMFTLLTMLNDEAAKKEQAAK